MAIPLWILFIHGFATGFFTTWLGLVLVNIHPHIRKLVVVGLCYALLAMVIRSLPLHFGLHFFLLTLLLIFIVKSMWSLTFTKALIPVLLGNLIMALGEVLFVSSLLEILNTNIPSLVTNNRHLLLMPLPQIILVLLLIRLAINRGIYIFNYKKDLNNIHTRIYLRKNNIIVLLVILMFTLLVLQVFYIMSNHKIYTITPFQVISPENLPIIMSLALISMSLIMLYFVGLLIKLTNQEHKFKVQETYLETIDEMIIAIRSQQHDQISHLQTLYGYLQLGYLEDARQYLEDMIGDIALSQRFANIPDPGLSALAYTKTALAIAKGIKFHISVCTDLNQLKISPYELNRILSNLIGNSFDHVSNLNDGMKEVWLRVDREDSYYIFEVANCGHIDAHIASRIFDKGVTTKSGDHAGLGLSIVRGIVNQHGGKVLFSNEHDKVVFSVYLPIKEDKHETFRPKVSSPASPKLA